MGVAHLKLVQSVEPAYDGAMNTMNNQFLYTMRLYVAVTVAAIGGPMASGTRAEDAVPAGAASAKAVEPVFDASQHKTADDLWAFIQQQLMKLQQPFRSLEDALVVAKPTLPAVDAALASFAERFPKDERRWESTILRAQMWNAMGQLEIRPFDLVKAEALLNEVVAAPDSMRTEKADASFAIVQLRVEQLKEESPKDTFKLAHDRIESFLKDYPTDRRAEMVMVIQAKVLGHLDPDRQMALLQKLSENPNQQVASVAKQELTSIKLKKEPLDLKFVDMAGKEVDLAKLRGKVVLIDFWATWCKPCLDDLPNVMDAHKKYKDKGLEILGISWDHKKEDLQAFLKQFAMEWPQYFEGKGGGDAISQRFGIMGIPTQWLVDKKGFVRDTDARGNLDAQIAKLLAE
jgi:thiol-disulfide isomerase/thioredoxin